MDKTLVLAGPRPKRVRFRIVKKTTLETTTWNAKGTPKTTKKVLSDGHATRTEFDKAVRKKLRDDYVYIAEAAERGDVIFEAFAPGGGGGPVLDMALDGSRIATATITSEQNFGAKVELVELATGARHILVEEAPGRTQCFLHAVLFDRAGTGLYYQLNEALIHVDISSGKQRTIAKGDRRAFNPHVLRPSFDRERRRLLVFDRAATVRVLDDTEASVLDVSTASKTTECRAAALSPSGRLLALYIASRGIIYNSEDAKHDATNEIQIWDIESRQRWETVALGDRKVRKVGLSPADDELLVAWDYASGPVALAIPSGEERWRICDPHDPTELGTAYEWTYSHDGALLAIGAYDLQLYDAKSREPIALPARSPFGQRSAECVTFASDGSRIAYVAAGTAIVRSLA